MADVLHPADRTDLDRLHRPLVASKIFEDEDEMLALWSEHPWRIQVGDTGEIAVVDIWREHLPHLSIMGLWCAVERVPVLVHALKAVARPLGSERLVSPVVDQETALQYEAAGMWVHEAILAMRLGELPVLVDAEETWDVVQGDAADLEEILALEDVSFEPFWRYDRMRLERYIPRERVGLVRGDRGLLGYVSSSMSAGLGRITRLAVAPGARRRGIARALVTDVLLSMRREGVRDVVLLTQEDNAGSRALYRSFGFRESGPRSLLLLSDTL